MITREQITQFEKHPVSSTFFRWLDEIGKTNGETDFQRLLILHKRWKGTYKPAIRRWCEKRGIAPKEFIAALAEGCKEWTPFRELLKDHWDNDTEEGRASVKQRKANYHQKHVKPSRHTKEGRAVRAQQAKASRDSTKADKTLQREELVLHALSLDPTSEELSQLRKTYPKLTYWILQHEGSNLVRSLVPAGH